MQLTDINVILGIITGVAALYANYYKKALKDAQDKGENNAVIITMLKHHEDLLTKLDTKLEKSASARHMLEKELARQDEQIVTLFNRIEKIEDTCEKCRKKCD